MNTSTIQAFLQLTPSLVSTIQAIEQAIPAPKNGPSKLNTFINFTLGLFALGAPIASAGIELPHDPTTIIQLSTLFANSIIAGIKQSAAVPVQEVHDFPTARETQSSGNIQSISAANQSVGGLTFHDPILPR